MTDTHSLVARLLATPDIARIVPQLPPRVLNQLIERCGLEACADFVALATPVQLQRVLDTDLWRAPSPGADERLDGERFVLWLEVLLDAGPDVAGGRLAAMDVDLVVGGIADNVRIFDGAAVAAYTSLDGELMEHYVRHGDDIRHVGGFVVEARRPRGLHAIVEVLAVLHAEHPAFFQSLMRRCVQVSHGEREADGCHDLLEHRPQQFADLAIDRETRRDREGYVAPAQARAFLQAARAMHLEGAQPPADPIARACLREVMPEPVEDTDTAAAAAALPLEGSSVTAVMEILASEGVVTSPRALLPAHDADDARPQLLHALAQSHAAAMEELAFLINAVLAGCSLQGRAFTPQEASDAVAATCNLGLENWPSDWRARDCIAAFQVGWSLLHCDLCLHAAKVLIDVLATLECSDRDVHRSLQALRRQLIRHLRAGEPWRARAALDAILMLDPPCWAVLRALLDECPTLQAGLVPSPGTPLRVDPAAFVFVGRNSDIAAARDYLASLASTLAG